MLIRKTLKSEQFFKEYLKYSSNELNITDKYSDSIKQSYCFIEHRHDQSIFSLLYKKYNYKTFKDPSQLGKYPNGYSDDLFKDEKIMKGELTFLKNGRKFRINSYGENYSTVLYVNKKKPPFRSLVEYYLKVGLSKFKLYKGIIR
jgi:hypothetical protein